MLRSTAILFSILASSICGIAAETPFFNTEEICDTSSLEIEVLQNWKPSPKHPDIQQKLIEVTVCEWWDGQKVRLPVTLNAPLKGLPCRNLIIANQGLSKKAFAPSGAQLDLLQKHGVGVVLIGMGTIDAMEPAGQLHLGMRGYLLKTKNVRYTPAWIWGMSQMRALTAALTESEIFQPEKVITTGGSKRGVAAAAAGIHDDRFTAILPVVAPIIKNPGTPTYVIGSEPEFISVQNNKFFANLDSGKLDLPDTTHDALDARNERRSAIRVTLEQTKLAAWTEEDIKTMSEKVWDISRITNYLPEIKKRGLDYFYLVGTNDSVSPGLVELGRQHPDFPICIIPGGQHGGPTTVGFTKQVPKLPLSSENFTAFAHHHFFGDRKLPGVPTISLKRNRELKQYLVSVQFSEGVEPESNELWWSINRNAPYTLPFEYDKWESSTMEKTGVGRYEAAILSVPTEQGQIDFLSLHRHIENGVPFTVSSPYQSITVKH